MKVILLQDIRGKGKKGQMLEVSDGYARNYMLPRKTAVTCLPPPRWSMWRCWRRFSPS